MTEEPAGQLPKHSPSPALVQQLDGLVVSLGLLAPDLGQKLLQICHSGRITDYSEVCPICFAGHLRTTTNLSGNGVYQDLHYCKAVWQHHAIYCELMDSSTVNKQIKSHIRPLLEDAGFSQFTSRTAWRYSLGKIDVLNFQSFNSYLASGVGCTTYSFCVRLGCSFDAIPRYSRVKEKDGCLRPDEHECHFRFTLQKSIDQPNLKRRDVWYVDPRGNNLAMVIADARKEIVQTGLNWFTRFQDYKEVLRTLLEDSEADQGTHGFGANPSPMRHFMTGFSALSLGQISLAKKHLKLALDSGCLKEFEPIIHSALVKN